MKCQFCGKENKEGAKFCVSCGKELEEDLVNNSENINEDKKASEEELIKCKFCGMNNKKDAKFCVSCGRPLDEDLKDGQISTKELENDEIDKTMRIEDIEKVPSKNKTKNKKIAVIGLIIIILIFTISYFYLNSNNPKNLYKAEKYQTIIELGEENKIKDEDKIYLANAYAKVGQKDKALKIYEEIFKDMPFALDNEDYFQGYKNYLTYAYEANILSLEQLSSIDFSSTGYQKDLEKLVASFENKKNKELIDQANSMTVTVLNNGKEDQVKGGYFADGDIFYVSLTELENRYNIAVSWEDRGLVLTDSLGKSIVFIDGKAENADIYIRVLGDNNYLPMGDIFNYFGMDLNIDPAKSYISWSPAKIQININDYPLDPSIQPISSGKRLMYPAFAIAQRSFYVGYGEDAYYQYLDDGSTFYGEGQVTDDGYGKKVYLINEAAYYPDYGFIQDIHEIANPVYKPKVKPILTKNEIYLDIDTLCDILCLDSTFDSESSTLFLTYNPDKVYGLESTNWKNLPLDFAESWYESDSLTEEYYTWIKNWLGAN